MNKITSDPRLPTVIDEKLRPLTQRLYELFRQFTNAVNGLIEFEESDWIQFTPTVTSGTGSFTSVSGSGKYLVRGKITHFTISVTCTTLGTASNYLVVSLPHDEKTGVDWSIHGRNSTLGLSVNGRVAANSSNINIRKYDSTFPIGSGETVTITGFYN